MYHIPVAIAVQLVLAAISSWWVGAAAAVFFYIGREITQAEYRVIEQFYDGKRANMPWYGGFEPRAWTLKSMLDWILPTITCVFISLLAYFI